MVFGILLRLCQLDFIFLSARRMISVTSSCVTKLFQLFKASLKSHFLDGIDSHRLHYRFIFLTSGLLDYTVATQFSPQLCIAI